MKIIFAADHAGYTLKEHLKEYVRTLGHEVEDVGASAFAPEDDYPDYIIPAARRVAEATKKGEDMRGIIIGGSGQGEAMVANRFPHVRAAVFYGGADDILTLSREHNDANVLSLGARFLSAEEAKAAVRLWLATPFSKDQRHIRRLSKLD